MVRFWEAGKAENISAPYYKWVRLSTRLEVFDEDKYNCLLVKNQQEWEKMDEKLKIILWDYLRNVELFWRKEM